MKILIYLFILASLLFASCKKENMGDCFKGTGNIITESRELPFFDSIYVETNINVFITIDSTVREVKVEAGENLLPHIITKVENGKLLIRNNNRCNFARSYKKEITVHITLPVIKAIASDSQGFIKSTNTLRSDTVDITIKNAGDIDLKLDVRHVLTHMHGAGDVILSGKTGVHEIHAVGNSFIRCADLFTGYTFIWANTTGNIYVNATKGLGVTIVGSGNVYYSGNPQVITSKTTGTGQIIEQK